jgi:hypothetical protein
MSRTIAVLLAGLIPLATAGISPAATLTLGSFGVQLTEPPEPSPGFNFGAAVDTDGATAIVGTRLGGSGNGLGSGSAYLFDATTGAFAYELTAVGGSATDRFADAVTVSGERALVGAFNALSGVGAAYVFDTTSGQQIGAPLSVGLSGDRFGDSLDLWGDLAVIGAPGNDTNGNASGAAYLFDLSLGSQLYPLLPGDPSPAAQFGYAVAIDGSRAAVTSRLDDGTPLGTGSVYLFDTATGDQLAKATSPNAAAGDRFGESVALDTMANIAIVGAPRANGGIGAAYLFDATTGTASHPLIPSDGAVGFNFGVSVAIEDGLAFVGASSATVDGVITGAIYAYDVASGVELGILVLQEREAGDNLGNAMAYHNGMAIFAASFDSPEGKLRAGSAFLQDIVRADIPEPSSVLLVLAMFVGSAVRISRNG